MPIYRLNSSGQWKKFSNLYRLNSSGAWKKFSAWYRLNSSGIWKKIFSSTVPALTQTSEPTGPSGSGESFTSVSKGSSGSYTNYNTTYGIVTKLIKLPIDSIPVSNTETKYGSDLSNTYTVTQSDATTPVFTYYTEDSVKNLSGTKTFYFYSLSYVQAYIGNITDNYNRSVASGLGTSSSSYIYSSYANLGSSWSVNGSRAVNLTAVASGAIASNHPIQTIEVGSSLAAKTNKTYTIDIPDGKGGQGVVFWTTSANSWYAVSSYFDYDESTTTTINCTDTTGSWTSSTTSSVTDCNNANASGSNVGDRCTTCSYTGATYPCTGTSTYSTTQGSATTYCESAKPIENVSGGRCGACTYTGSSSSYLCNGSGNYYGTSSSIQACRDANPIPASPSSGSRCSDCVYIGQTTGCTGSATYSTTSGSATTYCESANPIGSAIGDRCGSCTYTGSTQSTTYPCTATATGQNECPALGSGNGGRCGDCTASTTYPCGTTDVTTATCPDEGPLANQRCTPCVQGGGTTVSQGLCRATSAGDPFCPSCDSPNTTSIAQFDCATGFRRCRCISPITQTYKVRVTSTTYSFSIRQTSTVTTYSFSYPTRAPRYDYSFSTYTLQTTYNFSYPSRTTQYNFTFSKNKSESVTQYTYNTKIKIWSAISGTVVSQAWDNSGNSSGLIATATNTGSLDPSKYVGIYKITATTNGNTVTTTAYDSSGNQMGTILTKTFISPTKSNANNETSAGIIKAYSPYNVGTLYDNLSIS